MGKRTPLLECISCTTPTPHIFAYSVVGKMEQPKLTGEFRVVAMGEVEPTARGQATVVEQLYMCVKCGALRRWGLEVADEAGRIRMGGGVGGEQGGGGDDPHARSVSLVPEESMEAWAVRVGKRPPARRAEGGEAT